MATEYSIEALLNIVDRASPALERVLALSNSVAASFDRLKELGVGLFAATDAAGLNRQLVAMDTRLKTVGDQFARLADVTDTSIGTATAAVGRLDQALAGLQATAAATRTEMGAIGALAGGGGARGGGRGGGGDGGHIYGRAHAGPAGAHFGIGAGDVAGLGAGWGMYEGTKLAASEQLSYFYAELAAGLDPSSPAGREFRHQLQLTAATAATGTIYSRPEVAEMMPSISGMADVPLKESLPFMPGAIRFGEVIRQAGAAQGKTYNSMESASAAIQVAHLLGITDPEKMMPVLNRFVPAVLTSHRSPEQLAKIYAYELGSATGVGMSQAEAMNLGALGSIYVPGTRAGTSLAMMLQGLMPKGGALMGTKMALSTRRREALLRRLGLVDAHGKLFRDKYGGTLEPLLHRLHEIYEKDPTAAFGEFKEVFAERGARVAFALAQSPKAEQQARELERRDRAFARMGGVTGVQAVVNTALSNTALRSWADFKTILDDLASPTVPALTVAFKDLNIGLEATEKFLSAHKDIAGALGFGAGAAGIYSAYKIGKGIFGLGTAGTKLSASALALNEAAAALRGAAGMEAGGSLGARARGLGGTGPAKVTGLGSTRLLVTGLGYGVTAVAAGIHAQNHPEDLDYNSPRNRALRKTENTWLEKNVPGAAWWDKEVAGGGLLHSLKAAFAPATTAIDAAIAHLSSTEATAGRSVSASVDGLHQAADKLIEAVAELRSAAAKLGSAQLHMDGQHVGQVVVRHMEAEQQKPLSDASSFDTRLSPLYPGIPY